MTLQRDHPRLCGEKVKILQFLLKVRGSPPPMRGKVLGLRTSGLLPRITPAYAGKSASDISAASFKRDHPRLCGEKPQQEDTRKNQRGSPPPMRGKVFFFDPEHLRIGITPAYAGKSDLMGGFKMAQEDHPRLCGEK